LPAERIDADLSSKSAELRRRYDHWRKRYNAGWVLFFSGILSIYLGITYVFATTDLTYAIAFVISVIMGLPLKHDMTAVSEVLRQLVTSTAGYVLIVSLAITVVCLPLGAVLALSAGDRPADTETLFLRFYDVASSLQESLDAHLLGNEQAFETLREIVEQIEDEWKVPDEITSFVDDRDISDFKQNLSKRLLAAVKDGSEKSLAALIRIDKTLLNPGLESLSEVNTWMQNNLSELEVTEEQGIVHRIAHEYLTPNRQHIAMLMASALAGSVFYGICLDLLGASKDASLGAAMSVFAILMGAYVAKTR
jgi:hypothetical protein